MLHTNWCIIGKNKLAQGYPNVVIYVAVYLSLVHAKISFFDGLYGHVEVVTLAKFQVTAYYKLEIMEVVVFALLNMLTNINLFICYTTM